jgi:hypothetical protein
MRGSDMRATGVHWRLLHTTFTTARGIIDPLWYCGGGGYECLYRRYCKNPLRFPLGEVERLHVCWTGMVDVFNTDAAGDVAP